MYLKTLKCFHASVHHLQRVLLLYQSCVPVKMQSISMRVSQMKTLNIFLSTIYCAEVAQSCITFQHNLPHAECKLIRYSDWATGWTVRDWIPVGMRFSVCPDQPWGPSSLLYSGYQVFPGGKVRPGRAADHSPLSSVAVIE